MSDVVQTRGSSSVWGNFFLKQATFWPLCYMHVFFGPEKRHAKVTNTQLRALFTLGALWYMNIYKSFSVLLQVSPQNRIEPIAILCYAVCELFAVRDDIFYLFIYLNVFHRPSWLNSLLWRLLEVYYLLTVLWSSASLWLSHASKKSLSPLLSFFRVFLFGLSPQRRRRVIGGRRMTGVIRKECVERERRGIDES